MQRRAFVGRIVAPVGVAFAGLLPVVRQFAAATRVENRDVSGFDAVLFDGVGDLTIEQTGRERLSVEAEPAVLEKIVTEVRGRRLIIRFEGSVQTREPIRFRLQVSTLRSLEMRGSNHAQIGNLDSPLLALQLAGSGEVLLQRLAAREFELDIGGSGKVAVEAGTVEAQRVVIGGAGDYQAPGLASRQAEVSVRGSGGARIAVSERLVARVAGSGEIVYRGNPSVSRQVSGAGSIEQE